MNATHEVHRPFSLGRLVRNLVVAVVAVVVYAYGWRVTEIDLKTLVGDMTDIQPLVADLFKPELFTRETRRIRLAVEYPIPCPEERPAGTARSGEATLEVSPPCGETDTVTVTLRNARPNTRVRVEWHFPVGSNQLVTQGKTDEQGFLRTRFKRPALPLAGGTDMNGVEVFLLWKEGPLRVSNTVKTVLSLMVETVFLALMATTFGVVFALPISFLGARNLMTTTAWGTATYYLVRLFFNIMRSVETLIWAVIFVVWVGIGPFAGVLALTVHSIAALAKLYSEAIESIDPGPIEAVTATGANRVQTIVYAVIPQVIPPFIAFTIYRWDINVRMSTVVGLVGGGGIGYILIQYINLLQYRQAAVAMWAIVIVVSAMDYLSGAVREKVV